MHYRLSDFKIYKMHKFKLILALLAILSLTSETESQTSRQPVWSPDNGDGTYRNPVIYADYSDPDVTRVGDDYYMVSSSFSHFPGLPILHSKDLVNWKIIGHAVQNYPVSEFDMPQHGMAIWAPSIRFHDNKFYIYFGDPDRGIFMTRAEKPEGPWDELKLIRKVTGWIDCCPLWDDDGSAYLVHAFANSRSGIKSILAVNKMSPDGTVIYDDGILVFNGQKDHPTMEGPKFYKRNGYYYVFAPAGGVKPGWQVVLRSKNVFGPYEDKIVLEQGTTKTNGPHQGAWVTTQTGEDWFIHFQDRYAYGRIVHLQPVKWENDWPVVGIDNDGNGIGEPVAKYKKPYVGNSYPEEVPQTSDEFDSPEIGLQWQWESNFKQSWYSLTERPGYMRLYPEILADGTKNLWSVGRLLLQKMPAEKFSAVAKIDLSSVTPGTKTGVLVFGQDYSYIGVQKTREGLVIGQNICLKAVQGNPEEPVAGSETFTGNVIYLKVEVEPENPENIIPKVLCTFSYSADGRSFKKLGRVFTAKEGQWVGAKVGLFCTGSGNGIKKGFADADWFRIESL